jgi:hypothetical protein
VRAIVDFSRAGQAVQPEDASPVLSTSPVVYKFEKIDAGVGKASGFVSLPVRVERRLSSVR